jgi:hypothetical protein
MILIISGPPRPISRDGNGSSRFLGPIHRVRLTGDRNNTLNYGGAGRKVSGEAEKSESGIVWMTSFAPPTPASHPASVVALTALRLAGPMKFIRQGKYFPPPPVHELPISVVWSNRCPEIKQTGTSRPVLCKCPCGEIGKRRWGMSLAGEKPVPVSPPPLLKIAGFVWMETRILVA